MRLKQCDGYNAAFNDNVLPKPFVNAIVLFMPTKTDYAPQQTKESLGVSRESLNYYEKKIRRWRNRVGIILICICFGFFAYMMIWSGKFSIQTIELTGIQRLNEVQLQQRIQGFLNKPLFGTIPQDTIFTVQPARVEAFLRRDPRIGSVHVTHSFKQRSLTIQIEERVPFFIINLPTQSFAVDQEGRVLTQLTPPVPKTLPHITDIRQRTLVVGDSAFDTDTFSLIKKFREELPLIAPFVSLRIGDPSPEAITFTTEEGWLIHANMNDDAKAQLDRLRAVLATKISAKQRSKLQYIDLRFGEKVYFR